MAILKGNSVSVKYWLPKSCIFRPGWPIQFSSTYMKLKSYDKKIKMLGAVCNLPAKNKGQLISELNFGVFKTPEKPTKFLTDFCPSFVVQKSL